MRLDDLNADDLLLIGALRKAHVVKEEDLRKAVEAAPLGGLDDSLVNSGILSRDLIEDIKSRSINWRELQNMSKSSASWSSHDEKTVMQEARTVMLPDQAPAGGDSDIHEEKTLLDMNFGALPMNQEATIVTEGGETMGDIDPARTEIDPSTPDFPRHGESAPGSMGSLSAGSASLSMGSMSGSGRSMSQDDIINLRRLVSGQRRDLIGITLPGYYVHGRLGGGGMGEVYQATQLSLGREVALKILPPEFSARQSYIERFVQEARTLAKFTHSNIVQVYDVDVAEGVYFITMEQVRGQTLKALIDSRREHDTGVITNMLKQCVRGLNRALREGIIHRDIKPGNVLIDENGEIKIVDFGLAMPVDSAGKSRAEGVLGTPLYMSPEQCRGGELTFHSDMYSLGVTFYQLLAGIVPFKSKSMYEILDMHMHKMPEDLQILKPELPPRLCEIIMRMMAKSTGERFATYEELFTAIENFEIEAGIIKSPTDFLADSLIAMGDRGVRMLWAKVALMAALAASVMMLAFGIRELIDDAGNFRLVDTIGDIGTTLLALTYLSITYVGLVRVKLVPLVGKVKTWMNLHIIFALSSFVLIMVHSGNFLVFWKMKQTVFQEDSHSFGVAILPALNSLVFLVVIISGMVGRTIWFDIVRQLTKERIKRGQNAVAEDNRLTLTIFSQSVFKLWRILHYPLAVALLVLTIAHIVTIMFWRGF